MCLDDQRELNYLTSSQFKSIFEKTIGLLQLMLLQRFGILTVGLNSDSKDRGKTKNQNPLAVFVVDCKTSKTSNERRYYYKSIKIKKVIEC